MLVYDSETKNKFPAFIALTRLNRPIGIYLLLWPTLLALWFAADGFPPVTTLLIFILGTVLTRSAGCAINDYADRDIDGHVARTRNRPLATGALRPADALWAAGLLMGLAFLLVLMTNRLTIMMSFVAVVLASIYPYCKRVTHFPQIILGAAFAIATPMAYAAIQNTLPLEAWVLFTAAVLWAVAYDTLYAMADREDDLKIGVKSTAIFFGRYDLLIVAVLQLLVLVLHIWLGVLAGRAWIYFLGLGLSLGFVAWQLWISRTREPEFCIKAFLNNHYLGMLVFIALVIDYQLFP